MQLLQGAFSFVASLPQFALPVLQRRQKLRQWIGLPDSMVQAFAVVKVRLASDKFCL